LSVEVSFAVLCCSGGWFGVFFRAFVSWCDGLLALLPLSLSTSPFGFASFRMTFISVLVSFLFSSSLPLWFRFGAEISSEERRRWKGEGNGLKGREVTDCWLVHFDCEASWLPMEWHLSVERMNGSNFDFYSAIRGIEGKGRSSRWKNNRTKTKERPELTFCSRPTARPTDHLFDQLHLIECGFHFVTLLWLVFANKPLCCRCGLSRGKTRTRREPGIRLFVSFCR